MSLPLSYSTAAAALPANSEHALARELRQVQCKCNKSFAVDKTQDLLHCIYWLITRVHAKVWANWVVDRWK